MPCPPVPYVDAKGHFTYWSQRTFARPKNNGLRLDYFICSPDLLPTDAGDAEKSEDTKAKKDKKGKDKKDIASVGPKLFDSYMLYEDTVGLSDHCPVVLVLKMD
jgi:exonuclease III